MKFARLALGTALALTSVWALAQDAPESLLPPGFDNPPPKAAPPRNPGPDAAPRSSSGGNDAGPSGPIVQSLPQNSGSSASPSRPAGLPSISARSLPPIEVLEKLTPEELEAALGLKPTSDMPAAARRSMRQIGVLAEGEGGLPSGMLAGQSGALVRAVLAGNSGMLVSRWGHILLRRALVSRLDAPAGLDPADFAALRAQLLVRMGEADAARALVQDVDAGNFTPSLTQAALDSYVATADFTGLCPAVIVQGGMRKDAQWQLAKSLCAAFRGDGSSALSQLDRQPRTDGIERIDILLAQKYAGSAGKARRAVKIEWDDAAGMTPLRFGLTMAVGLYPPEALMKNASPRYDYLAATAPMLALEQRATSADMAAGAGILSSAAMVDLYSQIYSDADVTGDWSNRADQLRNAYVGTDAGERLQAMQQLWDGAPGEAQRYSRLVLTAYCAARLPVESGLADHAGDIIASMLTAGLDANAVRWAREVEAGSKGWALLALASPQSSAAVESGDLDSFHGDDQSEKSRKSAFLLAGLAGLDRITPATSSAFAGELGVDLARKTRWTQAIDEAAAVNNPGLVALLAGVGMQGDSWNRMTPLYLYHIVSALRRVGFEAEARMIAAEAVARS